LIDGVGKICSSSTDGPVIDSIRIRSGKISDSLHIGLARNKVKSNILHRLKCVVVECVIRRDECGELLSADISLEKAQSLVDGLVEEKLLSSNVSSLSEVLVQPSVISDFEIPTGNLSAVLDEANDLRVI